VYIDISKVHFIDHDVNELINDFLSTAKARGIEADLKKK
jgi:anti-anti-sigma regulatory factor